MSAIALIDKPGRPVTPMMSIIATPNCDRDYNFRTSNMSYGFHGHQLGSLQTKTCLECQRISLDQGNDRALAAGLLPKSQSGRVVARYAKSSRIFPPTYPSHPSASCHRCLNIYCERCEGRLGEPSSKHSFPDSCSYRVFPCLPGGPCRYQNANCRSTAV